MQIGNSAGGFAVNLPANAGGGFRVESRWPLKKKEKKRKKKIDKKKKKIKKNTLRRISVS